MKLEIAGIKWLCNVPEGVLSDPVLDFAKDFLGVADINLELKVTDKIIQPNGVPITKEILEWYINNDVMHRYELIKKAEQSDEIMISLKTNEEWSNVLIEIVALDFDVIDFINVLLLEIVFRNRLHYHNGIVLHSSVIEYEGQSIAFSAPSGTGKTTHVNLWQRMYQVKVINDDHPAIRIIEGDVMVFGTPWAGETGNYSVNSSPLKGIVVLEQGWENHIRSMSNKEIVKELLPRCFLPYYSDELLFKVLVIFNDIIERILVYKLVCRPDEEAVNLVKNQLNG